jgi:hypothetical protein
MLTSRDTTCRDPRVVSHANDRPAGMSCSDHVVPRQEDPGYVVLRLVVPRHGWCRDTTCLKNSNKQSLNRCSIFGCARAGMPASPVSLSKQNIRARSLRQGVRKSLSRSSYVSRYSSRNDTSVFEFFGAGRTGPAGGCRKGHFSSRCSKDRFRAGSRREGR